MNIIGIIILGALSGYLATRLLNRTSKGFLHNLILGVIGSIVGSQLFSFIMGAKATTWVGFVITAVLGALIVVWVVDRLRR